MFPCQEDLALLTHVREVDVDDTELANGDDDGFLAVVLANRLPVFDAANGRSVRYQACLVNLEGQLHELPPPSPRSRTSPSSSRRTGASSRTVTKDPDVYVSGGAAYDVVDLGDAARRRRTASGRPDRWAESAAISGAALDGTSAVGAETAAADMGEEHPGAGHRRDHGGGGRPERASRRTGRDEARVALPDLGLCGRARAAVPGARPLVVHDQRGRDLRDPDARPRRGAAGHHARCPIRPPHPRRRRPPSSRPATYSSTTAPVAATPRRRGIAARSFRTPPTASSPTPTDQLSVAHSADHLRRVVPDGREDLSYAAAFEIGRLLALSQLSVTAALLRFRQEQFGIARLHELVKDAVPWDVDVGGVRDLGHLVSAFFVDQLSPEPVRFAGPTRPVADPGRPIEGLSGLTPRRARPARRRRLRDRPGKAGEEQRNRRGGRRARRHAGAGAATRRDRRGHLHRAAGGSDERGAAARRDGHAQAPAP